MGGNTQKGNVGIGMFSRPRRNHSYRARTWSWCAGPIPEAERWLQKVELPDPGASNTFVGHRGRRSVWRSRTAEVWRRSVPESVQQRIVGVHAEYKTHVTVSRRDPARRALFGHSRHRKERGGSSSGKSYTVSVTIFCAYSVKRSTPVTTKELQPMWDAQVALM